jgi:GH15 family glucan-1,4-alpha-glucosidase
MRIEDYGLIGDLQTAALVVAALARNGGVADPRALSERLLGLSNDLGLLAEEYDIDHGRQVGNFPQAFSHLTLITAARAISPAEA